MLYPNARPWKIQDFSKFSIQLTINKAASNFTQENTWRHITWLRGNTSPENLNFQHKSRSFATLLYNFDQNQIIGIWNRVKRFPNCPMSTNCLKDLINSWIKWEKPQTPVDLETVLQPGDEVGSQVGPHSAAPHRARGILGIPVYLRIAQTVIQSSYLHFVTQVCLWIFC